jgi:hypothetical protein
VLPLYIALEDDEAVMKDNYDFSKGSRGKWCRKNAITRLPEVIADIKREARANGLTDADVDAELEAWRNEGRSNPSKTP